MKKLLVSCYLFLLFFTGTFSVKSQNLTISTTGQTGTSGTNWSISVNTLTVTGTADINASVINNHLATNALTIDAGSVTFNANISSTTANNLSILSKTFIINSSATTITTNGGSILFASNVDDAADGESTTNGYIQLRYGITINTNGGNITFGGGNNLGSEYSLGSSAEAYTEGIRFDGVIALNSGGGNITLRGKSYARVVQAGWGASGVGFYFFSSATGTITSGTGTLTIDGYSQTNTSSYASGIYSMHNMTITSSNTTANAIRLIGKATGSSGDAYGIETDSTFSVLATGLGGGITISSSVQMADTYDAVFRRETNILAKSGAIQLLGKQDGGAANGRWYISNNFYLGSKSATSVSTSSSNITIQYDKYSFSGFTPKIATSGTLTIQPASTSFGANLYTSWFSWNQNSQTMSGLTIGKSGNTASSVVLDSPLSVAGPITAYGATIYLYNNLTTTNTGAVSFYSDNAIVFDVPRTVTATGAFNYIPQSTSFVAAVTYPITNLTLSSAGLLIGNTTNTANITFGSATTTAGPITAYGGNISVNANLSSTATNADILLKATANINQAASTTVTTTGGVVNFWADSDNNSTGYVQLLASTAINSNGGNINLGGGSNLATGFAFGTAAESCSEALPNIQYISGVHMRSGSNLNSNGGNISIRGTNANISNAAMSFGVSFRGSTILSGAGKIAINGIARGSSSANAQGVSNWGLLTLRSANTTSDAISIIGDASATVNSVSSLGINLSTLIEATGAGGGISLSGKSGTETGGNASTNISGNILAVSGPITLSGENSTGVQNNINFVGATVIGKKASTNVLASSSNIILEGNVIATPSSVSVDCSGAFTIRSFGNSFASALSWPMTNVTLASSVSGLTIGKTTNSANVTFANATTIAGPITAYGGDISVSQNFTSTLSGADILLQATGAINLASNKTIQTSEGDVTLFATSGGTASSSSSAIYLNSNSQILSNGGNITLGGGYSGTEGNLYAATNISGGGYAVRMDASSIVNAAGGNISIYGRNVSSYGDGIYLNTVSISTIGSGTIGIYGDSFGGQNGAGTYFGGISFENNASIIQNVNGNITLKGILTNSQSANGYGINFYRSSGSSGLTKHIQILSQAGDIQITGDRGTSIGKGIGHSSHGDIYFGSPDNSYTASGDVKFTYSSFAPALSNGFKVKTTGDVTYEPVATSFDVAQTLPANSNYVLADGSSSLKIGKSGNTANITMNSAQTVAGPISIYAGTITLNAGLTATNSGDISFYSDNAIAGLTASRTVNAAGSFNYIPQNTIFAATVTYPISNLNVTCTGLLIGKSSNTTNVTFGAATTIAGPITVYGGTIAVNENISSSNGSTISLIGNALTFGTDKTVTSSNGQLIISPQNTSTTIGIAGASGTLALPLTYFTTNFADGFSNIQIGRNEHTAAISSNTFTLRDNMNFLTSGSLTLGGKPLLGSNNVTLGSAISSISASASGYFQTTGIGKVIRNVSNASTLLFPLGNSSYNPVSISNNSGSAEDFSVRLVDAVYLNGSSGSVVTTPVVNRTWDISKTNPNTNAGSGVGFVFNWNNGEVVNGSLNNPKMNHHTGTYWEIPSVTSTFGVNSLSVSGYTGTFSPFTVAEGTSALPVEMVSFFANCSEDNVELYWQTASEHNSSHFVLERSVDGIKWEKLGEVAAAGNSTSTLNYSFIDVSLLARTTSYYRLIQIDFDGENETYGPLSSTCEAINAFELVVSPNPSAGKFSLKIDTKRSQEIGIKIFHTSGKEIANELISATEGTSLHYLNMQDLASGVYTLHVQHKGGIISRKIVIL